ncbi:hypothetical protein N7925_13150 [Streptomyces sp. CA-278952]|uniref:hypothetical protein n=1 Tax=unclassified Streptomyces TaxID=2593676 RepID=UPI0022426AED|nr:MULTISPECIES: hypothetical protein [unclassified Streptomyces]UZI29278.1 hypothetical protein OH133_14645 [Streptomyces sp. VB1]WDG29233.1 hypothetical protein N7925_13150 [Streptomyces sp. CA-278952]
MPTPERAAQPRPTPSAVSMKDLLASCAAATAVSTPPSEAPDPSAAAAADRDRDEESVHGSAVRERAA